MKPKDDRRRVSLLFLIMKKSKEKPQDQNNTNNQNNDNQNQIPPKENKVNLEKTFAKKSLIETKPPQEVIKF